jgi:hypothetical protein
MGLTSHASGSEVSSPFYINNKETCEAWEKFVIRSEGKIRGKYSAWAFIMEAKIIVENIEWTFNINKSTMTNYFLVGKKDVHHFTDIEAIKPKLFKNSFVIRPKKYLDFFWKKRTENYIVFNSRLVLIKSKGTDATLDKFIVNLKQLDENSHIRKIEYNQSNGIFSLKLGSVLEDWGFLEFLMDLSK